MENIRNYTIDFIKFILACFIAFHHFEIMLYQKNGDHNLYFQTAYLAVEGFFIMSGKYLAKSYDKLTKESIQTKQEILNRLIVKKIKNLYHQFIFALVITILIELFVWKRNFIARDIIFNVLLLNNIGATTGIVGSWYVPVLFWTSFFYLVLMTYRKELFLYFYGPLISIIAFLTIYNLHGCLSVHSTPLFLPWLTGGVLRGILGVFVGVITYNFTIYYINRANIVAPAVKKYVTSILEILCIVIIGMLLWNNKNSTNDFLMYIVFPYIVVISYMNKDIFLHIFARKNFSQIFLTSYMIYLVHPIIINIFIKYVAVNNHSKMIMFICFILVTTLFAFICYHLQKWLFAKLKNILFVNTPQTTSQNISGEH